MVKKSANKRIAKHKGEKCNSQTSKKRKALIAFSEELYKSLSIVRRGERNLGFYLFP